MTPVKGAGISAQRAMIPVYLMCSWSIKAILVFQVFDLYFRACDFRYNDLDSLGKRGQIDPFFSFLMVGLPCRLVVG